MQLKHVRKAYSLRLRHSLRRRSNFLIRSPCT